MHVVDMLVATGCRLMLPVLSSGTMQKVHRQGTWASHLLQLCEILQLSLLLLQGGLQQL